MIKYVPLRLNTEFSIESGIIRLPEAIDFAKSQNIPALGISDLMNFFGFIKFYKLCRNNGIKPIIGVDFFIKENLQSEYNNLLLIAKNLEGYKIICQLLTKSYLENPSNINKAFLLLNWLQEFDTSNIICLSGAQNGIIGQYLIKDNFDKAKNLACFFDKMFPNSFYLEIQRFFNIENQENDIINKRFKTLKNNAEKCLIKSIYLAHELNLPVVATHPCYFLKNDYEAHETRVCINSGTILNDTKRIRNFHPSQYLLTNQEFQNLFNDIPLAIENSYLISQRCNVKLNLNKTFLPLYETDNNQPIEKYLTEKSLYGLNKRLNQIFNKDEININKDKYLQRLNYELEVIIKMGFAGYFLIVADFINWAKNNECPVGPGRGSGAGSLVAYSLQITDLDPLKYNLLFERFLNPERISMPDFDIDFCQENRNLVIDYVKNKYGEESVSQIITFSTLSSKAVIRDVGRVLELPFSLCDKLSKLIPIEQGKPFTLTKSMEAVPQIKKIIQEEEAEKLIVLAKKLEDITRGTGIHAGGVLIAPGKIHDFCPIYKSIGDGVTVSMYDKDDIEEIGLIKFDFLGLRNLTIIELTKNMIKENKQQDIDISTINLKDKKVFNLFKTANTTAIFQFESLGMKRMLLEARPTKFEEIIAFVALYRPGPMDLIPDFIKRMHKVEKIEYLHPLLKDILKDTYGIMVYQEQVMQVAQVCGGYSLGKADILRKAIGKKKISEMKKLRKEFVQGAKTNNDIPYETANQIFDYMEKFAGYGFNKSHAACYALIAYQTAWLKAYYTEEFIAATMSSEIHNTDQLKSLYQDAIINNIKFLPPCINNSVYKFKVVSKKTIRYALGALKGIGENVVEDIIKKRDDKPFTDFFDFCFRIDKNSLNKRTLESFIKAGAFDNINNNRAQLLENINTAIDFANYEKENIYQNSLFNQNTSPDDIPIKKISPWSKLKTLEEEKKSIGFYFSDHPFNIYKKEIKFIINNNITNLLNSNNQTQWIFGFVKYFRNILTKNNKKVCMITLDDTISTCDILIPEEVLNLYQKNISQDATLIIKCKANNNKYRSNNVKIIAQEIMDINILREKYIHSIELKLNNKNPQQIKQLNILIHKYITTQQTNNNAITLKIHYQNQHAKGTLISQKKLNIITNKDFFIELENIIDDNQFKITLHKLS